MLPAWIIEELEKLRREQESGDEREQARLPLYEELGEVDVERGEPPQERGVLIIEL